MNAKEAFEKTNSLNQGSLPDVRKMIANMVESGYYEFHYTKSLSETDINQLIDEGYEIYPMDAPSGYMYYYKIRWQYVKK